MKERFTVNRPNGGYTERPSEKPQSSAVVFQTAFHMTDKAYSGLNLNQDKAEKPQTVQIVRQGEATQYWFKLEPLYIIGDTFTDSI